MMKIEVSSIVISLNGREKDELFFVTNTDEAFVSLVNGKSRKLLKPKRKKEAHVRFISESAPEIVTGIKSGSLTDKDLRKALAKFKTGAANLEGGTYDWPKMM
jgi:ribosomal protein L14E/L6E/L27E